MTLSRGAIGNLVNRYRAVLRKCRMMNVFGSLAMAGMLVAGNAGLVGAEDSIVAPNSSISKFYDIDTIVLNTDQPQESKALYAIGTTGSQGKLDISMEGDAALTVEASWARDAVDSNQDQLSAVYVGNGAQFSFTGTGLFRATGQGKVMEAVAFRNGANGPTGGIMRLTGTITGEAITEASAGGSGHKAIGVKAENPGTIIFSGKSAWLKAIAHAGTADGVYARYGGAVDFQSEEVKILSQSDTALAASGLSIEYSGGTITASEKTALTVDVKAPASTATGISLSGASNGLVDLAGSLAVSVAGSPAYGINNVQGTLKVAKASSIKGTGAGSFPSYGIWGTNGSTTDLKGDVDIDMTSATTVYGVYADNSKVSLGSEGDVNIRVQGNQGYGVSAYSGGNVELGNQGKEVSIVAPNIGIQAGSLSHISLNGKVKIESGTGINLFSTSIDKFPSLVSNGLTSIISTGTGILTKYAHAVFNELHIQAGTGIDVQSPGFIGSGNTDTVLDFNGPAEIVAQNTALQIVGASGSSAANSGFVGTFKGTTSLKAINGNGVQLSGSTHSGTTAAGDCSVTFEGQTSIVSEKGTGVVVNGPVASAATDHASVVFGGVTTIDAVTAIEIKKNKGKGASVTFAYNPTPINVPARAQDVDSQVNGSVTGTGTLVKSGCGSLALNGDNSSFSGEFNMQGGMAFLGSGNGYFSGATVNLTGGTLVAPELRFSGGKLLITGGTLKTGTGQLFTSGLNAEGNTRNPGSVKLGASNWKFDSGLIAFDDAKYNLTYAQVAATLLGAKNAGTDGSTGSVSAKELIFTGEYVDAPAPAPISPYYYVGNKADAASDDTMGLWLDSTGDPMTIKDVITVRKEPGQANEYHFLSGVFDGSRASSNTSVYACLIHGDDSGVRVTSDGPLTIQGWGNGAWPYHAIVLSNGQITFGDDVSLINNSANGHDTKGGGAIFSKTGVTFGDNAVLSGNSTALAIGGESYGGGAIFLDGKGAVKFGKNALIEKNQSYNYGGAIYSKGSVSMGEGAIISGNKTSYMGGALAVNGALSLGSGSLLEGNQAQAGGAVYSTDSVNAVGTTFKKNIATTNYGGGIDSSGGSIVLTDSRMEENQAVGGGAIYLGGGATAKVAGTAFTANTASNGGAFFINTSGVLMTAAGVTGTSFTKNSVTGSGGAVYAQNGTVDLGSGTRLEGNQAVKGGAVYLLGGKDNSAKLVLTDATLTGNAAVSTDNTTTYGGAVYSSSTGTVDVTATGSVFENNRATHGGAAYLGGSGISNVSLTDVTFKGNHADNGNGGAVNSGISNGSSLSVTDASFENNSAKYGGALFNSSGVTATGDMVFSGNTAEYGGAIYNYYTSATSGSIAFNGGARFTGNTASGLGGAIYNTRAITLNPGAGQEIVFSGNTDSTGSNAIFMADGSSLNITGEGKVVFDDALSSENAAAVKKTGGGILLLNASMNGFLGTASFEAGRTEVAQNWLIKNTVTVSGGKLKMPEFLFAAQDAENGITGGRLVLSGGILETGTGQFFTSGLNAEGNVKDPGAVKLSANNWSFDSGLIAFDDAKYNLFYAQTAASLLGADPAGSDSAKEITFTGTLVNIPVPDPVSPYTYVGTSSNAASDETAGAWQDSTGASIPLSRIIQKTSEGGHSVYTLASGVYDGGSRAGSRFLQEDGSVHEIRSDGNLVLQNWFFEDVNGTGSVINTGGSVLFGDNVSILNNRGTGQGGAIHASKGVTFGAHALIRGNKKTGMFAPGGGAIASEGNVVFGDDAELSNNEAGSSAYGGYGGALFVDGGNIAIGDRAVIRGNVSETYGGALYAQKQSNDTNTYSVTLGSDAVIEQNTAGELGGGIFSYHPVTIGERATLTKNRSDNGGAIWTCSDVVLGSGTIAQSNTAIRGGAIYSSGLNPDDDSVTGGKLIATDTAFEKNNAEEKGGALYVDHGAVELKVTGQSGPVVISGNTAGESGGFMYLDNSTASFAISSGGTMRIGDAGSAGAENHLDTIGGDADSSLIKQGAGSLVIESSMSDFLGSLSINEGTLQLAAPWAIQNTVTLNKGGTLKLPEFSFVASGVGKLILAGGTLNTGTGQIFTNGLNAEGDAKDPGAVKLSTGNWSFNSGLIAFDDAKYNLFYAQTAASLLGADLAGSDSAKEITFTGTLVELPSVDLNSFETLQQAVLDTSIDRIRLGSDIVLSKRLQGNTAIARSLDINGNGHTISGPHPGLWFKGMDSGTVSIRNITFDGLKTSLNDRYEGPVSFGPAIFFDMGYFADNWKSTAKLIIGDGVEFRNMEAVGDGAGGAVRTAHGIVEIGNNVRFVNNSGGSGGGLYSESFTTIGDNVVFEGNKGRRGGALNVVDDYEDYLTDPDYASGARRVKFVHIGKNALFKDNSVELLGSSGNGGAIEVQSGELSIDDGATFTGNTSKGTGGALSVCDWSPQLPAKATLGSATFLKNRAGSHGGAVISEGDLRFNGSVSFVENTAGKIGGAICNLNMLNIAAESTFSKNTAGSVGGGLYNEGTASLAKASFTENKATEMGGAVFNVNQMTFADGAAFSGNSATDGGAVYNDFSVNDGTVVSSGSIVFNGGVRFTGNTASGLGGAIYNTRAITLNPGKGQEIVFSGNTDSTGSNAIFMADGSSLNITGEGKVVFDDALSSENAAAVKKTGGGTLLLSASMNGFLGTASFEAGRTEVAQNWLIKNTVTVSGGRLKMPEFSFAAQGEGGSAAGGKLILAGGILETGTGQIFANGLNAEGDNEDPGAVKLSADHWSFDSGLIAFNDANYNLTYAQAAADSLGASNVEAGESSGSTSAKEITFIGTGYVDPTPPPVDPDPVPPVDPDPTPPVDPDPVPPAPEPIPDQKPTGTVSVDELNNNHANNIVLGNVTIATGTGSGSGKDFVVGASATDDKTDSITGSIGGKNIDLGSTGRNVSIVGGQYLTLVGGSSDTPLVTAGGNPVNIHVGDNEAGTSGVLNLGTPVMDSGGSLSGNIQIGTGSKVNVRAGTHTITGEANETTGTADVAGMNNNGGTLTIAEGAHLQSTIRQTDGQTDVSGKLTSASVELSGGGLNVSGSMDSSLVTASKADIKVAGTLSADVLTTSPDVQINVGNQENAGRMIARQAQLQGGRVFLDPAWKGNDVLADASHGVFTFVNNDIDGLLTAGQNSLLVFGDVNTDWALDAFGRSGLRWGQDDVTAVLAIRKPQTLNGTLGAVMVDGSKTSVPSLTPNTATFAAGSLLVVDGNALNGAAALTSQGGTLDVDAGAKLLIDDITQGEYTITSGFAVSNVLGWNGDNLSTPDNLIGLALSKAADGSMKIQAKAQRSSDVFQGLSLVNTMDAIWGKGHNDTESDNMGIRFLSRAANETYLSKADTVRVVDGGAQIAVAGGVQGMAVAAADAPIRALQDHASLSHLAVTREGSVRKDGLDLWINALYGAEHARNLGAGALDGGYNADFGGVVFGGDYAFGDFRVGMALNAGSGTSRSRGDFNATKNDFDFWGVNLYGSWSRDQFNILGDLGYSANKNEVKQDLPATMQLGQLQADVDTGVLTAGLRGEYRFEAGWADVTPHVGVRYYNLRTDGFTSRIGDHDVFRVGRDTQEIWTFPIGVSLSHDFETSSGWKVKPRADLSVVPAAGDLKARTKVRVPGVAASDTVKARMMDSVSFDGTIGLEVGKDNVSFGLDYGIRASEHKTDHGVNLSFTYKF